MNSAILGVLQDVPAYIPPIQTLESRSRSRSWPEPMPAPDAVARTVEYLPFSVRVVRDERDLHRAVAIRYAAYARHVPEFAQTLRQPEAADFEDGVAVLLAESKLDGTPLGTMRIQTNRFKHLPLEQSVKLPDWLHGQTMAEATRLGITEDRVGRLVKTMLFKVFYQYCLLHEIDWMVIAGRSPIDRQYERLLFQDVYPGMGYIPLRHANNMPHRVMAFNVPGAQARWAEARHPLLGFMCDTHHPDIDLGVLPPTLGAGWVEAAPRTGTYA